MSTNVNVGGLINTIPKLSGLGNYYDWKFATSMVLRRTGAWDIVTESKSKPSDAAEATRWEALNQEALTIIGLSVEPSQYGYIRDSADGIAAWKALAAVHEKVSRANRIALKRRFYNFKHDTDQSIHTYINGIQDLASRLKGIKVTLQDDDIVDVLIFNLDESWSNIAGVLCSSKDELKLSDVTSALIDEEGRRGYDPMEIAESPMAMAGRARPEGDCWRCGKRGHMAKDCWAEKPIGGGGKRPRKEEAHSAF